MASSGDEDDDDDEGAAELNSDGDEEIKNGSDFDPAASDSDEVGKKARKLLRPVTRTAF